MNTQCIQQISKKTPFRRYCSIASKQHGHGVKLTNEKLGIRWEKYKKIETFYLKSNPEREYKSLESLFEDCPLLAGESLFNYGVEQ